MKGYSIAAMGGYSLLILGLIFFGLDDALVVPLGIAMMFLANFMNHPHFMASYRLFFAIYPSVKKRELQRNYIFRWWIAAVVIPLILTILLIIGGINVLDGDEYLFTVAIFFYGVSVGWHYVKQGFGMAMSEAALKKCYWITSARRWMLWNAYACWIFCTCLLFSMDAGIEYFGWKFSISSEFIKNFILPSAILFFITTIGMTLGISKSIKHWYGQGRVFSEFPNAGLVGYLVSLYVWVALGVIYPMLMLVIPFFHSLQYMHIVDKLYLSEEKSNPIEKYYRWLGLVALGILFFWLLPGILDYIHFGKVNLTSRVGVIFTASVWLFINIHHYFIDNVIWRKENKYIWEKLNA